ncbi:DNA polymerase IV [Marinivivus vitaminiproducens]|uniref:DNA polymerase IV n=1 Tax=Marinivivus vitaminiproducens TaxID=3035935 RepID=UPI0027AB832B|nr:DNA polymerase IV [Geminicoccaceae bacterium SCSIO 64248]
MRKILHIDMDAFFAAVEQRDDPDLRGKAIAVGGGGPRGVVMTASYEARPFGVRSAMPGGQALRRCPHLIFVRPRMDVYREVSHQLRAVFARYTTLIEPLAFDEAYLDVTEPLTGPATATDVARAIKADILSETGLTASAGVSFTKFLAKIASGLNKPDGLTVITPDKAAAFVESLPVERFHGVGPVTARRMHRLGIRSGADLLARSEQDLERAFGRAGLHYARLVRLIDDRPVQPDRQRKSIGAERTFSEDLTEPAAMLAALEPIAGKLAERMAAAGQAGRTVTLKIKHADFTIHTRSHSESAIAANAAALMAKAAWLLERPHPPDKPVRLLGLSVANLVDTGAAPVGQLALDL